MMGKALIFFSLGLFAQEFGQVMYSYYLYFQKIEVPYPSLGDVGYFGSIPLYILGVLYLAKASGVKIGLSSFVNKIQAILIPGVILVLSYYFFMQGYVPDWSAPIRTLLDFGYPLGQAIYISLALLTYSLSRGVLGGVMKPRILFILFALFVQYIADFSFLYLAQQGQAYPGSILDYAYILAYFLMGIGLLQFGSVLTKLREK